MTDTRKDQYGAHLIRTGRADSLLFAGGRAGSVIADLEAAGLGVFDPQDGKLIRALGLTLRREISSSIPVELADTVAAQLLHDIREAYSDPNSEQAITRGGSNA